MCPPHNPTIGYDVLHLQLHNFDIMLVRFTYKFCKIKLFDMAKLVITVQARIDKFLKI